MKKFKDIDIIAVLQNYTCKKCVCMKERQTPEAKSCLWSRLGNRPSSCGLGCTSSSSSSNNSKVKEKELKHVQFTRFLSREDNY